MTAELSALSAADAVELIRAQVAKAGADYVYPDFGRPCLYQNYTDDNNWRPIGPGCLVGHVFYALGVPPEQITPLEDSGAVEACIKLGIPAEAADVLQAAQVVQDEGRPWGEALTAAEYELQAARRYARGEGQ